MASVIILDSTLFEYIGDFQLQVGNVKGIEDTREKEACSWMKVLANALDYHTNKVCT